MREVGEAVNNAVVKAFAPSSIGPIPEPRLRKLRAYSQGLLAPMLKHVEEEIIRPEEVVMVLLTAALFTQLKYVMRTDKLPLAGRVNDLYEGKEAVILPERYLQTPEPAPAEILPAESKKRGKRKNV